ncbi:Uncharacterised protein [Mycobacteroides abscessus subsp. abscessus]|nr:Uncharacterised protein [Mycobacteroides abscessus subsp. abscessus]
MRDDVDIEGGGELHDLLLIPARMNNQGDFARKCD